VEVRDGVAEVRTTEEVWRQGQKLEVWMRIMDYLLDLTLPKYTVIDHYEALRINTTAVHRSSSYTGGGVIIIQTDQEMPRPLVRGRVVTAERVEWEVL